MITMMMILINLFCYVSLDDLSQLKLTSNQTPSAGVKVSLSEISLSFLNCSS